MRGYQPGRFSFNVKGGRCDHCSGDGTIKIEMNFLPDVYVPCEVCKGARYNRETLEVHYKGRTIAEVLDMPIEEAEQFFAAIPAIHRHLRTLVDVGLGYVRLGQPAPTLSGGEAQRVKLASELQKRSTGRTVYVLDEPTTGLHFDDIRKLLRVLSGLVDKGNTVIVIEHNLDVIKTADWLIDMGRRVTRAAPWWRRHPEVALTAGSYTGQFLRPILGIADEPQAETRLVAGPPGQRGDRPRFTNGRTTSNRRAAPAAQGTTGRRAGMSDVPRDTRTGPQCSPRSDRGSRPPPVNALVTSRRGSSRPPAPPGSRRCWPPAAVTAPTGAARTVAARASPAPSSPPPTRWRSAEGTWRSNTGWWSPNRPRVRSGPSARSAPIRAAWCGRSSRV